MTDPEKKYLIVVDTVMEYAEFHSDEIKSRCEETTPAFVTRVLNELTSDGWLQKEGPKSRPKFRWLENQTRFDKQKWLKSKTGHATIHDAPCEERPRERLLKYGAENLRLSELLAILIRVGRRGETAVQAGEKIANAYAVRLECLPDAKPGELNELTPAVAPAAYCQIMAGVELGRRIAEAKAGQRSRFKICGAADAKQFCEQHFRRLASDSAREEFHIVTLDTKHQVIATHQISVGTLDASLVHPREVFRAAIKDSASSIILVHNHPSGDPTPSREDRQVTRRLESCGQTLGMDVLDHIIVTQVACVSLQESG